MVIEKRFRIINRNGSGCLRTRSESRAHHLTINPAVVYHGSDLEFILWVHHYYEVRWVLQEEVGAYDSLPHQRHKIALLARVYIDHPVNARAGRQLQQIEERNTFGACAP